MITQELIRETATGLIDALPADADAEAIQRLRYRLDGMAWLLSYAGYKTSAVCTWLADQDRALFRRWQNTLWRETTRID